jgi:glycosyltransferase involved in cell wall biosynthesis
MTLGVVSLKLFYRDGDRYVTTGGFGRQMEALAPYFERVVIAVPVAEGRPDGAYEISSENVEYCPLPAYRTQPQLVARLPVIAWRLLRRVRGWDLVNARLPDLTGWLGFAAARLARRPVFVSLVGDWGEVVLVRGETSARGAARWLLNAYIRAYLALERAAVRRALTFAGGRGLFEKYRRVASDVHLTVWTTVRDRDIAPLRDTCGGPVVRLLFVGRLTRAKGLQYLMSAVAELVRAGRRVHLDLVGDGELRDEISSQVEALGISDAVAFHGRVALGDELLGRYRSADVFVLPSVSEGTPKVILEAMASCLPVVSTDVGGISTIVRSEENGLLVPPKSPPALATAVARIIDDGEFRRVLIRAGRETAAGHTIDGETRKMIDVLARTFPRAFEDRSP